MDIINLMQEKFGICNTFWELGMLEIYGNQLSDRSKLNSINNSEILSLNAFESILILPI